MSNAEQTPLDTILDGGRSEPSAPVASQSEAPAQVPNQLLANRRATAWRIAMLTNLSGFLALHSKASGRSARRSWLASAKSRKRTAPFSTARQHASRQVPSVTAILLGQQIINPWWRQFGTRRSTVPRALSSSQSTARTLTRLWTLRWDRLFRPAIHTSNLPCRPRRQSEDPIGTLHQWAHLNGLLSDQAQPQQRSAVMPSNFAGARSVGRRTGPAWAGPTPLNDIFNRKTG